jgi:hypothetical protein
LTVLNYTCILTVLSVQLHVLQLMCDRLKVKQRIK